MKVLVCLDQENEKDEERRVWLGRSDGGESKLKMHLILLEF